MADAAAKREARRKRILQNSEDRLQRITGRAVQNESTETVITKSFATTETSSANIHSENKRILETEYRLSDLANVPLLTPNINDIHEGDHHEHNGLGNMADLSRPDSSTQPDILIHHYLHTSYLCYVFLAAIVNIALFCDMDYIYGKAITIPCFTMMLCRLCICKNYNTEDNSLLFAALILCNIRPQLIHRMRIITNLFSIFFKELSLYLFSFVLIYYGISLYKFKDYFNVSN